MYLYPIYEAVIRIRDVYPGSRIQPQQQRRRGEKTSGHKYHKIVIYFIFLTDKEKNLSQFTNNYSTFCPKKLSLIFQKYGFGIRDPKKPLPDPRSKGHKGTGSRLSNTDLNIKFRIRPESGRSLGSSRKGSLQRYGKKCTSVDWAPVLYLLGYFTELLRRNYLRAGSGCYRSRKKNIGRSYISAKETITTTKCFDEKNTLFVFSGLYERLSI